MSRFESSRFVRNPQIMNANVLMAACETLGWKYSLQNNILLVTEVGNDSNFNGEFALKLDVSTNEVTYNTYYMPNAHVDRIILLHLQKKKGLVFIWRQNRMTH